jgi:hypothetical protein
MSATVTLMCGHCCAITAIVGPPTYPAPMHAIEVIFLEKAYLNNSEFGVLYHLHRKSFAGANLQFVPDSQYFNKQPLP